MASLVGSVKNMMSDAWWFVPIGVLTAVLFLILDQWYHIPQTLPDDTLNMFLCIYFFILFGIVGVNINRNINNKSPYFPGIFSIFEVLWRGICTSISIIPGVALAYWLNSILTTFTFEYMILTVIFYAIAIALVTPFIFIPAVLCNVGNNPLNAFRLNILFLGAGNVIVQYLSYLLQYALIIGTITAVIYYFILQMLGDHCALLILKCLVIVITFLSAFSYASDLYGDAIPEIKEKVRKPKKKQIKPQSASTIQQRRQRPNGGTSRKTP